MTLDSLAAVIVAASVLVELFGGFAVSVRGLRISAHDGGRTLALALLLIIVRRWLGHRTPPFGLTDERWLRWRNHTIQPQEPLGMPKASPTRIRHVVFAVLGLCAFAAVLLRPQLSQMMSVPDLGDPLFSVWRMNWVSHQILSDPRALFDANIFYPHPLTLTYSDSMLLPSLASMPLLALGVHPVVAYNTVFVASFVLSGLAMFLLASELTGSRPAAFVSALLFGFYPYRFEHYSHFELQMTMWMPLALLALHRFIMSARWQYAALLAICIVAQSYSSMYYGVFFCLYAVPITAVLLFMKTNAAPLRRLVPGAVVAAVVTVVCLLPLARPYLAAKAERGERDTASVEFYSAFPSDYLQAHDRSALYGRVIRSEHPERAMFPGVVAVALAVTGLVPPLGTVTLAYGAGLLFALESSLGFHGWLYPWLYDWLSPVRGLRVPARFGIIVGMTLALLAAVGFERLRRRLAPQRRAALFVAAVALVAVDLWPRLALEPVWPAPPAIYRALPASRTNVLAEFPVRRNVGHFTEALPFMYFSLWHWTSMVNGYSGFSPKDYDDFVDRIEDVPDPSAVDALRKAGVTHVTFNCALYSTRELCENLVGKVEASPRFHRVTEERWQGELVRLYELR